VDDARPGHLRRLDATGRQVGDHAIQNPSPLLEGDGCYTCDGSAVGSSSGSDGYINSKWSYSLSGLYNGPWGINFGGVVTGRQGYIRGFNVRTASSVDGVRRRYVVNNFEDYRFPNLFQLDLKIGKEFHLVKGTSLEFSVDAFNVTNERVVLWQDYELIPQTDPNIPSADNAIQEMQSPRILRLGARLRF
jgi:hypothetical protein